MGSNLCPHGVQASLKHLITTTAGLDAMWKEEEEEQEEEEEGSLKDLCHRGVLTETWLGKAAAEPEQQEANPEHGPAEPEKPSLGRVRRCTSPLNSEKG
ncbi:Hypothetical predicted protein [Xyrichtys novacula]|uniref:Uncharacterized protein n=1 Tax=Xyrichtys novacula TaxID=13765 RepID=A0AAV1GW16_XYRNO|nr:Hypothetical predicted protein [Xyrichtys novacula]